MIGLYPKAVAELNWVLKAQIAIVFPIICLIQYYISNIHFIVASLGYAHSHVVGFHFLSNIIKTSVQQVQGFACHDLYTLASQAGPVVLGDWKAANFSLAIPIFILIVAAR